MAASDALHSSVCGLECGNGVWLSYAGPGDRVEVSLRQKLARNAPIPLADVIDLPTDLGPTTSGAIERTLIFMIIEFNSFNFFAASLNFTDSFKSGFSLFNSDRPLGHHTVIYF